MISSIRKYESVGDGPVPILYAISADRACHASHPSTVLVIATLGIPMRRHVRKIRHAISPRFATKIFILELLLFCKEVDEKSEILFTNQEKNIPEKKEDRLMTVVKLASAFDVL
jgi:hypothetical protein